MYFDEVETAEMARPAGMRVDLARAASTTDYKVRLTLSDNDSYEFDQYSALLIGSRLVDAATLAQRGSAVLFGENTVVDYVEWAVRQMQRNAEAGDRPKSASDLSTQEAKRDET